jgi:4-hydroxy-4-methyl-2-oxoglutarate aldolase
LEKRDAVAGLVLERIARADRSVVDAFAQYGVATVHEAQARTGLLAAYMSPIYAGPHISGTAVTVSVPPADNWMIHVAVEQCQEGDVLVVAPTSPSDAGYFGELLATALQTRGARGVVIDAGCRDVSELRRIGFPAWSKCVSAFGTVKATLGSVNVGVVCAGQWIEAGDVIVADDDGVVVVARRQAEAVLEACATREHKEGVSRRRYQAGELSLDVQKMRERLTQSGLRYVDQAPER